MKMALIILLILVGIPVGVIAYIQHTENIKMRFATFDEVRREGAIGDETLIPELLLPESATDITVQVDADTNELWLTYSFAGKPSVRLPECTADPTMDVSAVSAPWWWSRAAADIARDAHKYRCIDRGELVGFWLSSNCVLVQNSGRGAFSCGSDEMRPK